jgi:hypothetical protein
MAMNPRLLRPRATGFTPKSISGLVAWWDAQVASSYDLQTGVQNWRDLSGNGHTVSQSTTNNQPTLSTINGRTALLFDGTNDQLAASTVVLDVTSSSAFSFFGVTQIANTEQGFVLGHASGAGLGTSIYANTTTLEFRYGNAVAALSSPTKADNVAQVWSATHNNKSGTWSLDGAIAAAVTTASTFTSPAANFVIGNRPSGAIAGTFLSGRVGSLLIYNRDLSLAERRRIDRWLGSRWGITVA